MAVGDSLMQQVLGLGLAARISAKLGEGVLNGLMTARFGLAALSVCRPLPFIKEETPKIGDVAGELVRRAERLPSKIFLRCGKSFWLGRFPLGKGQVLRKVSLIRQIGDA